VTLRRCFLSETIIKRADEIFPLDKYKNRTQEELIEILMNEIKNDDAFNIDDECEKNDINGV